VSRGIKISKAPVPKCAVCGSLDAEYLISYWDKGETRHATVMGFKRFSVNQHQGRACLKHILEVTTMVLVAAGVIITEGKG
jgi:hypothetical protein